MMQEGTTRICLADYSDLEHDWRMTLSMILNVILDDLERVVCRSVGRCQG